MPIYAGVGISTDKDYKSAIVEAVAQARKGLKQKEISLAIVLTSTEFASPYLLKAISNLIGTKVPLLGATSNAILTQNGIYSRAVAITLISANEAYFNIAAVKDALNDPEAGGKDLGKQLLFTMNDAQRRFCLLFSDAKIIDNLSVLRGLQEKLGYSFPIIGATTASDNIHLNKTYQYYNHNVFNNSIVGLLFSGKVNFGLGIKHGWKPIGKPHPVNKSDNFIIQEIDNKPAVSLYQDYLAKDIPELKKELKRISCLYPIGINIPGEREYLLRNIISIQDDGSLICRGNILTDSQVRLMIGTKESCLAATEEATKEAKQSLELQVSPKQASVSIIFVFNSVSRLYLLGRQIIKELEIIKSHFPGVPIIGICTYGEQAPLKATDFVGKSHCHNQTIAILAIS